MADARLLGDEQQTETIDSNTTTIADTTLDAVGSINGTFAGAVFIGLSLTTSLATLSSFLGLGNGKLQSSCLVDDAPHYLLLFEMLSFGAFFFSSLVAQGLKLCLVLQSRRSGSVTGVAKIKKSSLVFGVLSSAFGSVLGGIFLYLSLVCVVLIKFGAMFCGTFWSEATIIPLSLLFGGGAIGFISVVFLEFTTQGI